MVKTFRFNILSDSNWEARIREGLNDFSGIQRYFETKDYGTSVDGIVLDLMCRAPELQFKQRKRFSKKDKMFYMDIMLDYNEMTNTIDPLTKAKIIVKKIERELFSSLEKYEFADFDLTQLKKDFKKFVKKKGLTAQ